MSMSVALAIACTTARVPGASAAQSTWRGDVVAVAPSRPPVELWTARFKAGGSPCCEVMSPDGGTIYVGGLDYRLQPPGSELFAYAASTGTELWAQRQHQDAWLAVRQMAVSRDGSTLYVTGIASHATYDFATAAYRASTGEPLWVRTY